MGKVLDGIKRKLSKGQDEETYRTSITGAIDLTGVPSRCPACRTIYPTEKDVCACGSVPQSVSWENVENMVYETPDTQDDEFWLIKDIRAIMDIARSNKTPETKDVYPSFGEIFKNDVYKAIGNPPKYGEGLEENIVADAGVVIDSEPLMHESILPNPTIVDSGAEDSITELPEIYTEPEEDYMEPPVIGEEITSYGEISVESEDEFEDEITEDEFEDKIMDYDNQSRVYPVIDEESEDDLEFDWEDDDFFSEFEIDDDDDIDEIDEPYVDDRVEELLGIIEMLEQRIESYESNMADRLESFENRFDEYLSRVDEYLSRVEGNDSSELEEIAYEGTPAVTSRATDNRATDNRVTDSRETYSRARNNRTTYGTSTSDLEKVLHKAETHEKILYGAKLGRNSSRMDYMEACEEIKNDDSLNPALQISLAKAMEQAYLETHGELGDGRNRVVTLEKDNLGSYCHVIDKRRDENYDSKYSIKVHTFTKNGKLLYTEQLTKGLLVVDDDNKIKKFREPKLKYFNPSDELLKDKGLKERRNIFGRFRDWASSYIPSISTNEYNPQTF